MKCLIFGGWVFPCFFAARTAACQASSCAHLPICRGHKSCHLGLGKSYDQMTGSNQQVQLGCFFRKKTPKMRLFGPLMICCHVVHQHPII